MSLRGQGDDRGYAMAALLVSLAVMSVLMSVLLPAWRHQAQREKEAELAFRGEQYARAIYLYQAKFQSAPPSIDVLVQQKFLRKKYKDPMTKDGEFQLLYVGQNVQPGMPQTGQAGAIATQPGMTQQGRIGQPSTSIGRGQGSAIGGMAGSGRSLGGVVGGGPTGGIVGGTVGGGGMAVGGVLGVVSKSKEASIRIYRGATHYNEWRFFYNAQGRGGMPGQRGMPGMPGVGPGGQRFPGSPGFPGGGRGRFGGRGRMGGPGTFGPRPPDGR